MTDIERWAYQYGGMTPAMNATMNDWQNGFDDALGKARDAVKTECLSHHGYTPGQTCPYCTDALAAIDALRGES